MKNDSLVNDMLVVAASLLVAQTCLAQSVTFIDPPAGQRDLNPNAISADGQTVVGHVYNANQEYPFTGFRWTAATGVTYLPGAVANSLAEPWAVSANGSVVVGDSSAQAFVWSSGAGTVLVGPDRSSATDISADGSVIVGYTSVDQVDRGFVKVGAGALVTLEPMAGMTGSVATAVSADGTIAVGRTWKPGFGDGEDFEVFFRPVKWVNGGQPQIVETPAAPWQNGEAVDVSADGSIIVGTLTHATDGSQKAFVTTPNGVQIVPVPCESDSQAIAVSADGRVIVGDSLCGPWIWDGVREVRFLYEAAVMSGLDLQNVSLEFAKGVSADGTRVLVSGNRGLGFHPMAAVLQLPVFPPQNCSSDFNGDWDFGTDLDIAAFFACLGGNCCATCGTADFNNDGDTGTDQDIEAFFRVLGGGSC